MLYLNSFVDRLTRHARELVDISLYCSCTMFLKTSIKISVPDFQDTFRNKTGRRSKDRVVLHFCFCA